MNSDLLIRRSIRVFISSTFRDMQDERDYLMKRTFPKLRELAFRRNVTLTELDLRWGITEEESKSGKVVEICLREIENSIPFFIGIIGNRYGWVPNSEDLGENVIDRFKLVDEYVNKHLSVTEIEMQYGVLSRQEDMHAFFYIKEHEGEVDNPEMLRNLKEKVRKSKYPSSVYNTPEDLGQQVETAFITLLDKIFPEKNLSEHDKERVNQQALLNQLCQNYIKDEANFNVLNEWLKCPESPYLIVTGPSGMGKSALIANWVKEKLVDEDRDYNIIYYFTGYGGSESGKQHLVKHIIGEINTLYGVDFNEDDSLDDAFVHVNEQSNKPLLLVIDAINQIEDADNAKLLNWLPSTGSNIKILISTLDDDRTMSVFKRRRYPIFCLKPLDISRRAQLVKSYLKSYGKALNQNQLDRIVEDEKCENTLVLRTLLDELLKFGVYEELDKRIDYYLRERSVNDFYQALLYAYEEEYAEYGEDFVEKILSLIAVSKDGLTEDMIMAVSNAKQYQWSQLYCSLINSFCHRNGKINFAHIAFRKAIERRYSLDLPDIEVRLDIVLYLYKRLKESQNDTFFLSEVFFYEVPYQLFKLGDQYVSMLYDYLKSPACSSTIFHADSELCLKYWTVLRENSFTFDSFVEYSDELFIGGNVVKEERMLYSLLSLLHAFGEYSVSLKLATAFVKYLEDQPQVSKNLLVKAYNNLANELCKQKSSDDDFHASFDYFIKAINIAKENSLDTELAVAYNGMARGCIIGMKYDLAVELASRALKINLEIYGPLHHEVAVNYNTLANAYEQQHDYDKAIDIYIKSIEVVKTIYGEESYQLIVLSYNLASTCKRAKRFKEAIEAINLSLNLIELWYGESYYDLPSFLDLKRSIESSLS